MRSVRKFKITFRGDETEEVDADGYEDREGRWIEFTGTEGSGTTADPNRTVQVLRIVAGNVKRIEVIG